MIHTPGLSMQTDLSWPHETSAGFSIFAHGPKDGLVLHNSMCLMLVACEHQTHSKLLHVAAATYCHWLLQGLAGGGTAACLWQGLLPCLVYRTTHCFSLI
jgi:hypothetical protein